MAERIVILRINCRRQRINRRLILLINMGAIPCIVPLTVVPEHHIKDLDPIFSIMFHMINCQIYIFHQLFHVPCRIRSRTDTGTHSYRFQLHIRSAVIHNINLFCNRFHHISGGKKIISR